MKKVKYILPPFILLCLILCCCNVRAVEYPFQISRKWRCENPPFSLSYSYDEVASIDKTEILTWNDQEISVNIAFGLGDFCVFPAGQNHNDQRLFSGTWYYKDKKLVLELDEDFFFGGLFSELEFIPE